MLDGIDVSPSLETASIISHGRIRETIALQNIHRLSQKIVIIPFQIFPTMTPLAKSTNNFCQLILANLILSNFLVFIAKFRFRVPSYTRKRPLWKATMLYNQSDCCSSPKHSPEPP